MLWLCGIPGEDAEYNADVLLLGCTELPLAIKSGDISVPILNTTQVHIDAIFKKALY